MSNISDTNRKIFSEWMLLINSELGTQLELDEADRLCLLMPGDILVGLSLDAAGGCYHIYAPLLELEGRQDVPVLGAALELNLYQEATRGGTIGLDAAAGTLVYSFTQRLEHAGAELLATQLNQMAALALALRGSLKLARSGDAALTPEEEKELAELEEAESLTDPAREGPEESPASIQSMA